MCLKGFMFLPRHKVFCFVWMFVCFFPLFSCEGEVGMWIKLLNLFTSSYQNHHANIRRMACTVSSVRDLRPLPLMDSSTSRKRIKVSLMCAEWKLLLTSVGIHSPIGIFTFSCYSLECKPKNEVEKFNGRNSFLDKKILKSMFISPNFRLLNGSKIKSLYIPIQQTKQNNSALWKVVLFSVGTVKWSS